MGTNKTLKKIEKNSVEMGDLEYKKYKKTSALASLKGSISAYQTAMRAVRYQLLFNNTKK